MTRINNNFFWVLIIAIAASSLLFLAFSLTLAISEEDIVYPVPELGNCKDETACRAYCDKPQNLNQCLDFAEEHNLIPEDELEMARRFEAAGGEGPGGCTTQGSCESYCNDIANIDECLEFAEENNLMPPDELEEARKVQAALAAGAQLPGGCRNKDECEAYCESGDSSRMEECIAFAEAAGFIPPDELEEARMVLEAMKKGAKPPPCRGRDECDDYCAEPANFEQCITFAEAAGFVSPDEAKMARKTGGKGPGGCRGRECEDFCEKEENMPVCIDFAVENGMMKPEEAEMARKTGGKGPGNCKGREECESFCEDPANQEVCFNFAKEHGLIPEEDLRMMEEGRQKMMEGLEMAPPEVLECLTQALGADKIEGLRAGTAAPSREMGDAMQSCFGQMMGGMGPPGEGGFPGGPPTGAQGVSVVVEKGSLGLNVIMTVPSGIQEFSIQPSGGSDYGGGVPGCKKEFKAETPFSQGSFPIQILMTDCNGEQYDFSIEGLGRYSKGGESGLPGGFPGMPGGPPGGFPDGPGGFPGGPGGFPGKIPSGESFVGPGGCATPEECIRYCKAPEHKEECNEFKTAPTTPYAGGAGPGGCGSVEECREYCNANPSECEGFVSEETPSEVRCQSGFETKRDNRGNKYCSPTSCSEGQEFTTDMYGRQACSPIGGGQQQFQQQFEGAPPGAIPTPEQIQQFQQQMQQQFVPPSDTQYLAPPSDGSYTPPPDGSFTPPPSYTPPPDGSYTPPPDGSYVPPPSSSAPKSSFLGNLFQSLLKLLR